MKILIEESVLRQALEALEQCYVIPNSKMHPRNRDKAITELRTALNAAEKIEEQLATVTAERDELVAALKSIVNTHDPDASIRAEIRWEIAEAALAKVGKDES